MTFFLLCGGSYQQKIQPDMNAASLHLPAAVPLLSSSSPPHINGLLLSNKSMKIWVKYGCFLLEAKACRVSTVPVYPTHIPITVNGLLLQHCLCQFRGWGGVGAPAGMTEGGEYAMGKTFWQMVLAKPDGKYYRL